MKIDLRLRTIENDNFFYLERILRIFHLERSLLWYLWKLKFPKIKPVWSRLRVYAERFIFCHGWAYFSRRYLEGLKRAKTIELGQRKPCGVAEWSCSVRRIVARNDATTEEWIFTCAREEGQRLLSAERSAETRRVCHGCRGSCTDEEGLRANEGVPRHKGVACTHACTKELNNGKHKHSLSPRGPLWARSKRKMQLCATIDISRIVYSNLYSLVSVRIACILAMNEAFRILEF